MRLQACGIICKNSGGRFSEWLDGVCRLLLGVCQQQQGDDELRENGLQVTFSCVKLDFLKIKPP